MTRIIRLTESDLTRIVKRVIKEQDQAQSTAPANWKSTVPEVTVTGTRKVDPQLGLQATAGTPITLPYLYLNYKNQHTYLSLSPSDNVKSNWTYTLTNQPKTKTVGIMVTNDKEPTIRIAATHSCASNTTGTNNVYSKVTSKTASINSPTMARPAKNSVQNPKTIDNYLSNMVSQSGKLMNFGLRSENPDVAKIGAELKKYCGK